MPELAESMTEKAWGVSRGPKVRFGRTAATWRVPVALLTLLMLPAGAHASTVTLTDWVVPGAFSTNAPGGGGPFKATVRENDVQVETFMTFCLEFNEPFRFGKRYGFELSDAAKNGGVNGGPEDQVSAETKWLYYQARFGDMSPILQALENDPTTTADDPVESRTGWYVQEAIWWLEQEKNTIGGRGVDIVSYHLAQFLLDPLNGTAAAWSVLEGQGHRVFAMNLAPPVRGQLVQDQLYYQRTPAPVPEAGVWWPLAAVLGAMVVADVRARRRRPLGQS